MNLKQKIIVISSILSFAFLLALPLDAQKASAPKKEVDVSTMTEGEFAVILVRVLMFQRYLPPAPTQNDCMNVLDSFGISPVDGWHPERKLSQKTYNDILNFSAGKEAFVLDQKARQFRKEQAPEPIERTVDQEFGDIDMAPKR